MTVSQRIIKLRATLELAAISINPNKTNAMGAATISVNPKSTSWASASVENDVSSSSNHDCQDKATDPKKGKRKRVTNFNINEKVVRETGDSHPPAEDELSLYGGSDLDQKIDPWNEKMDTTINPKINFANNHKSEPEESDDDDVKDIANGFSAVEKTVTPIVKKWIL